MEPSDSALSCGAVRFVPVYCERYASGDARDCRRRVWPRWCAAGGGRESFATSAKVQTCSWGECRRGRERWRWCRIQWTDFGANIGHVAGGVPVAAVSVVNRRVKLNAVLDQTDDTEVAVLPQDRLNAMVAEWRETQNDCELKMTRWVDFAVFRPFSLKIMRKLKFTTYHVG
eukprot:2808226-Amphidinium_carterae.1